MRSAPNRHTSLRAAGPRRRRNLVLERLEDRTVPSFFVTTYAAGKDPWDVEPGDFNGDGAADLAVTQYSINRVMILLSNGDGTFRRGPGFPSLARLAGLVGSDFDRDGALDLAISYGDLYRDTVTLHLGNGDGTFREGIRLVMGIPQAWLQAAADLNNDGLPDLIGGYGRPFAVRLNTGGGTFGPPQPFEPDGTFGLHLTVADFNNDTRADMIMVNSLVDLLSVFLGNGDGTFQAPRSFQAGTVLNSATDVADFNADGAADLVLASGPHSATATILLGNGDGTFRPPFDIPGPPQAHSVVVADFNGDGRADFVSAGVGRLWVWLGNGDGTFRYGGASKYLTGLYVRPNVADFNGDALPDLVVSDTTNHNLTVFLNRGDWRDFVPSPDRRVGHRPSAADDGRSATGVPAVLPEQRQLRTLTEEARGASLARISPEESFWMGLDEAAAECWIP